MRSTSAVLARLSGVVLVLAVVLSAQPAGAHTDFDYSVPTDGASVGEPVSEVTVAFTLPVTLVGNGFEVLDPQENLLQPFAVTDDDTVFRLQFDPPLAGGAVGVKFTVTAADGHVLSGAFSFTVSVDLPPPTTVVSTSPPATQPPVESTDEPSASTTSETAVTPGTVPAAQSAAEQVPEAVVATPESVGVDSTESGGASNSGLLIGIAVGVALLASVFLIVRARSSTSA